MNKTGNVHVLFGTAYNDVGEELPMGGPTATGNIKSVYLFNNAISTTGPMVAVTTPSGKAYISSLSTTQLQQSGLVGYGKAIYDPNNVVNNLLNASDVAVPVSPSLATLAPLTGYELEDTSLYLNNYLIPLAMASSVPPSMTRYL